jgi:hypothetical protein
VSPEISGAPGKEIFSTIYPLLLMTAMSPSSDITLNSYLATYKSPDYEIVQAVGPNLPEN